MRLTMSQDAQDTASSMASAGISIVGAVVANSEHFLPVVQFAAACIGICAGIATVVLTTMKIVKDCKRGK